VQFATGEHHAASTDERVYAYKHCAIGALLGDALVQLRVQFGSCAVELRNDESLSDRAQ
jgi:hypothetical protein